MASENLSTLSLLIIVVACSLIFYGTITQTQRLHRVGIIVAESAEAFVSPNSAVVLINVKNVASIQLRTVVICIDSNDVAEFKVDLHPGASHTLILRDPLGFWFGGQTKKVVVTAFFADGSETSTLTSIRVHGTAWAGVESKPPAEQHSEKVVFFMDSFKEGLSEWHPWGNATALVVEVDRHGKPSPCLHIFASGVNSLAGASKTVNVNLNTPATLNFTFDYNIHAPKVGNVFPGNLWVRVLSSTGSVLVDEEVYEAESTDSGWKSATVITPPVSGEITLIVYARLQSPKGQDTWVDNAVLCTT